MKRKYNKDVHYICKLTGIRSIEKVYGKLANRVNRLIAVDKLIDKIHDKI